MQINKILTFSILITNIGVSEILTVPGQYSSIQAAINASNEDTVMVSPGLSRKYYSMAKT